MSVLGVDGHKERFPVKNAHTQRQVRAPGFACHRALLPWGTHCMILSFRVGCWWRLAYRWLEKLVGEGLGLLGNAVLGLRGLVGNTETDPLKFENKDTVGGSFFGSILFRRPEPLSQVSTNLTPSEN